MTDKADALDAKDTRIAELEIAYRRCHDIIELADCALDPSIDPGLSRRMEEELEPCDAGCPSPTQWEELKEGRDTAEQCLLDVAAIMIRAENEGFILSPEGVEKVIRAVGFTRCECGGSGKLPMSVGSGEMDDDNMELPAMKPCPCVASDTPGWMGASND